MTGSQLKRRARTAYAIYKHSTDRTLDDVYGTYSVYKARAYRDCIELMYTLHGFGFKIITHNQNVFTCGFVYEFCNKIMFMYITPNYRVAIELPQGE